MMFSLAPYYMFHQVLYLVVVILSVTLLHLQPYMNQLHRYLSGLKFQSTKALPFFCGKYVVYKFSHSFATFIISKKQLIL